MSEDKWRVIFGLGSWLILIPCGYYLASWVGVLVVLCCFCITTSILSKLIEELRL